MIEARTVAFILIILLIAFIVYRLCLSNERKTNGGFDNLNDVVVSVFDSIGKNEKPKDIDIAVAKLEVLKTLNLVLEDNDDSNKTLKTEFYNNLHDEEKLAFIEALIHSLYVEGYVPSEFIGYNFTEKQVILKARHNYIYSDIVICLNDLPNKINDMNKYLNTINNENKGYKISICNSIKAYSVSKWRRWGVYEYVENDDKKIDIDYKEDNNLFDIPLIHIPNSIENSSGIENIRILDNKQYNLFDDRNNSINISNNYGTSSISQSGVLTSFIEQNDHNSIINNTIDKQVDEDNSIHVSSDKKNGQISNNLLISNLVDNNISSDDIKDDRNSIHNNLNNGTNVLDEIMNLPDAGEYN